MKKHLMGILAAVLVLTLAACGGGSSGGPSSESPSPSPSASSPAAGPSSSAAPEPVELRIMWWGDQTRADLTNQALRKFEEKYPHIKVVGEFAPSSSYFDKLNTLLASGTAPDVFFLGGN